ncbi:ALMS1 protein, partial [Hippolais icterina]|nr:ALMS1 protein [Hippolais icterina]
GDLEIVSSATRKNTRDVGVTFPTPRSSQHQAGPAGAWQQPRAQLGTWTRRDRLRSLQGPWLGMDTRIVSNLLSLLAGTLWLVPAEELKRESRKENQSSAIPGPGPAWFEPWSSRKPWREPLREKNWEEQPRLAQGAA